MKEPINKKPIAILPYGEVDFKFVSSHYDIHLGGSCIYENQLCLFVSNYPDWDEEKNEWQEVFSKIYALDWKEKLGWRWRQWKFEKCVGYHWSYRNGKRGNSFHYRKPQWLYSILFNLYFKIKNN